MQKSGKNLFLATVNNNNILAYFICFPAPYTIYATTEETVRPRRSVAPALRFSDEPI